MIIRNFLGKHNLKFEWHRKKPQVMVIVGEHSTGKTQLLKEYVKRHDGSKYVSFSKVEITTENILKFLIGLNYDRHDMFDGFMQKHFHKSLDQYKNYCNELNCFYLLPKTLRICAWVKL